MYIIVVDVTIAELYTIYCAGAAAWQLSPGCSWRSDFPASRLSPVSANVIAANKTMHVSRYVKM